MMEANVKIAGADGRHEWDRLRATPSDWTVGAQVYHESLLRAFRVLTRVRAMLERGDSQETVVEFIEWASTRPEAGFGAPYVCKLQEPYFIGVDWARREEPRT